MNTSLVKHLWCYAADAFLFLPDATAPYAAGSHNACTVSLHIEMIRFLAPGIQENTREHVSLVGAVI